MLHTMAASDNNSSVNFSMTTLPSKTVDFWDESGYSTTMNSTAAHQPAEVMGIDHATYALIDTVINCFAINVLAIFGTFGNVITLVVLARHGVKNDTTNMFLMSLTVFDLLFCITIAIRKIQCVVSCFDRASGVTAETFAVVYIVVFNRTLTNSEIFVVAAISVERFVAVWFPFRVARIFTPRRVKVIVFGIVVVTVMAMFPVIFSFTYEWTFDPTLNATVATLMFSEMYTDNFDLFNLISYVGVNITLNGIPWLVVVVCGIATGMKVVRLGKLRKRLVRTVEENGKTQCDPQKTHKDTTGVDLKVVKMLGVVCLFSAIVFLPTMLLDVNSYFIPNFMFHSNLYTVLGFCIDLLYTLNASGNFLIYALVSDKFSKSYIAIFRQCGFRRWNATL